MKVKVTKVTPEIAEQWLRNNKVNRKLRKSRVNAYARDMSSGSWRDAESMIMLDGNGQLLNGQHRLSAIIQSGATVEFVVAEGASSESMEVMDSGAARTTRDTFQLRGYQNVTLLSSTSKLAFEYANGLLTSRLSDGTKGRAPTRSELVQFIEDHPGLHVTAEEMTPFTKGNNRFDAILPAAVGAAHWIISQNNDHKLATFYFEQISSPVDEPEDSAIHAINSKFRSIKNRREKVTPSTQLLILLRGWNLYAVDSRTKTIRITPTMQMVDQDQVKQWGRTMPW